MNKRKLRKPFIQQFYRHNKLNFSLSMLATAVMAFVNLVISWMLQQVMDLIAGAENVLPLPQLLWVFAGVIGMVVLVGAVRAWAMPRFYARAMRQYKDYAFEQLLRKNISTFFRENTSTYLSAFSNDATSIEANYLEGLFTLIMEGLIGLGAFLLMFWYSPLLAAIALGLSLAPLLTSLLTGKKQGAAA